MGSYKKIGLSHEMGLIDTPPLDILRKIAESIRHGLVKSKTAGQKTQRDIPAKNRRESSTPRLLKK